MASVTFSTTVGGDGSTVTDDANPTTGLGNGGHRTRLVPALSQVVAVASNALGSATAAAASALTAINAPGTQATSTTPNDVTGAAGNDKTWTIQTGKSIVPGMSMVAARTSAPATTSMLGVVKTYNSGNGQLVLTIASVVGSGTGIADWTFSLTASAAGAVATSRTISAGGIATGGGDMSANRTITVTKATGAEITAATDDTRAVTPKALADSAAIQVATDGATITPDFSSTFSRRVTLGASGRAFAAPTGGKEGYTYALSVIQDATGNRTGATWNAAYDWGSMGAPTLSTAANKRDIVFLYCYDAATPKYAASFWKAG